jgi:hypothetical protein
MWAKLDDAILDNPKIIRAGAAGFLLHVAAITWCARNLSDGFIPKRRVWGLIHLGDLGTAIAAPPACGPDEDRFNPLDAHEIAEDLARIGLWHDRGEFWELHDYLVYNPSRAKVLADREHERAKKARQKKARGDSRGDSPVDSAGILAHPVPVPVPVPKKRSRSLRSLVRSRTLPDSETLTPERMQMAQEAGLTGAEAKRQWRLLSLHEFKELRSDWDRTWQKWCLNSIEYARTKPRPTDPARPAAPSSEETRQMLRDKGLLTASALPFRSMS